MESDYNKLLNTEYGYETWIPHKKDIDIVDKVLLEAIENDEFDFIKKPIKENIDKFLYKQYIPYIDENGHRIIYLNTFCEIGEWPIEKNGQFEWKEVDWRKEYYHVNDGGFCYWRVTINIDKEEYSNLMVNGV